MNWKKYFNTNTMTKARIEISKMSFIDSINFISKKYNLCLSESIDFSKAFSNN